MTFRWYGPDDSVPIQYIAQIPCVTGIVSALYDLAAGEVWARDSLEQLSEVIGAAGLHFSVVESIPVHEDIKLGRASRDRLIDNYCRSVQHVGEIGVPVVCYNFMPVFDWMRTDLAFQLPDGSTTLAYDHAAVEGMDLSRHNVELPGWAETYDRGDLDAVVAAYREVDEERLWENLAYFLERVIPVAAETGVRMAIHPDDPPWAIFGLPRIITTGAALTRAVDLVDDPANGVTICTGSLAALPENDLPAIVSTLGARGRVHFAHLRNVHVTGDRQFHETAHPSRSGDVNMLDVMLALHETGFDGPMRPDHGRMIWNEVGRPGYGLHDRALGAMYLQGLWEAVAGTRTPTHNSPTPR